MLGNIFITTSTFVFKIKLERNEMIIKRLIPNTIYVTKQNLKNERPNRAYLVFTYFFYL